MQHPVGSGSGCIQPKCQDYLRSSGVDGTGSWRCCKGERRRAELRYPRRLLAPGGRGLRPACSQPKLPDQRNSS